MTTNSIQVLKSYIDTNNGLQRPNRYKIDLINIPSPVKQNVTLPQGSGSLITLFSGAVNFGGRTTDVTYDALSGYGFGRMVPKSTRFVGGVMAVLPVTGRPWVLDLFNRWFDYLYGQSSTGQTNFSVPYYDEAVQDVQMLISLLDLNGNTVKRFYFSEVYPIEALPLEFNMASTDKFLTYQVTFNYRKMSLV